jgi:hypothetical protein
VTASKSKKGAIQLRDVVLEANSVVAVVLESCTLKKKLKAELLDTIGYSGDADQHVYDFIRGLFGKSQSFYLGVAMPGISNSIAKKTSHQSSAYNIREMRLFLLLLLVVVKL